jgi:hypothetical protein
MILQWKGGWFVYDAEHQLQMLGGRCCPASLNFLHYARAAQSVAGVSRLVFHTSIVFPRPEDRFGFAKSNTHTCADRIQLLTFECQNVCQKGFNTIMHRICPDVVPELSSVLTVGRATADYPAMGFNKRKTEDARWPRCSRLGMSFSTCRGKRPANQRSRPGGTAASKGRI